MAGVNSLSPVLKAITRAIAWLAFWYTWQGGWRRALDVSFPRRDQGLSAAGRPPPRRTSASCQTRWSCSSPHLGWGASSHLFGVFPHTGAFSSPI